MSTEHEGFAGSLAGSFIQSKLTPLVVIASILLGLFSVIMLPREEEPQIKVPMIDVLVAMPGSSASEVQQRVIRPMEQLLWEIDGVEYVYSTAMPGRAMTIVRFEVGEDNERALVNLHSKLQANFDIIPQGVSMPLVKLKTIDDVSILALTLHSDELDHYHLRRLAAEMENAIKQVPDVAETSIIGGVNRQIRVELDPVRLAAHQLSPAALIPVLQAANAQYHAGNLIADNKTIRIESGGFFHTAEEVGNAVVGVFQGAPVALRDVAEIRDGPADVDSYVFYGSPKTSDQAAVTLSVAKRPGTNAITVAEEVLQKVSTLRGQLIPDNCELSVTRHYGDTAAEKSNELLFHMGIAIISVSLLIMLMLGWRESLIVLVAIPTTLALTLLVFYLYGYTLNRITLFALIFSIGILVDDAIVVVENIVRHRHLPESQSKSLAQIAVHATAEVGNPTILATWAVIAAILPMATVGGLMGPYMRPIPIGASAAMFFSLIVAFMVTPWAALHVLKRHGPNANQPANPHEQGEGWFTTSYRWFMGHLIHSTIWRWVFLGLISLLLLVAMALVPAKLVQVKMLPFDNKSEFQVIVNMPEGSSLEQTARVTRELAASLRDEPELENYQVYVGTAAPFNFNGLVRHYFMRSGAPVADIQVNLKPKHDRAAQSHAIAGRVRPELKAIADRYGANIAVAEVPPGPPVLQTLVAEIYAPDQEQRIALASAVKDIFESTDGVVDVDWYVEAPQEQVRFVIDKEKAALHGIPATTIATTLEVAVGGTQVGLLHQALEKEDVPIRLELPRAQRSSVDDILGLRLHAQSNHGPQLVPLRELVQVRRETLDQSIYHKNLMPVTYVTADVAGTIESPIYAILEINQELAKLKGSDFGGNKEHIDLYNASLPTNNLEPAIKWDGEWQITIEVFRDLGIAFGMVCILIYLLMVGWFKSFMTPIVVMSAIPFSLVGILPAHAGMGAFFTATSMIGFMAGAGIVVRNSIILVDFIDLRLREGMPLDEAVIDAGAVRFRPMLLTAAAVMVGAGVILMDPIFQGLAISLIFGEIASLLISRMAVPVLYFMANRQAAR